MLCLQLHDHCCRQHLLFCNTGMSIHSLDHSSVAAGNGYKGYHIDDKGEVTEFYDHRSEETAPSSVASARQPLVNGTGYTSEDRPPRRRVKHRDAGKLC